MRRWWAWLLPDDEWSREFLRELDDEARLRWGSRGIRGWTGRTRQALSPRTWQFIWLMRRRHRSGARTTRGKTMRTKHDGHWWRGTLQDVRQAARSLAREPRFTGFAVLTLALGMGGVAAMYGVADRLFLTDVPGVEAPDELARLYLRFDENDGPRLTPYIPYLTARAIQDESGGFTGVTLYRPDEWLVQSGMDTRPRPVQVVDAYYFEVLGANMRIGRGLDGDDAMDDVAVIGHDFWLESFAGDPAALGRTIRLPHGEHTVVGVAEPGFHGPHRTRVDVWVPLRDAVAGARSEAGSRNWHVIARARPVAAMDQAIDEAQGIHARTDPGRFFGWASEGVLAGAPIDADEGGEEPAEVAIAQLLLAVTGLVLLIGCANVANLFLARLTRRRREVAVRLALGVGRWRLARFLMTESLLVAAAAAVVSLPLAYGAGQVLRSVLLPGVAWSATPLDLRVLAATGGVAMIAGVLVALLPLRRAGRADVADDLRGGGRGSSGGRLRLHGALAAGQIALSGVLLVAAGLFLESFQKLRVTDLGVDADRAVVADLRTLDPDAIPSPSAEEHDLYLRALEAVRADPGVESAAVTLGLPFLMNFGISIAVPGRDSIPELPGGGPWLTAATAGYFETLGTSFVAGRGFTEAEARDDAGVIVVSEAMAVTLWPGGDPLGQCVQLGTSASPCRTVIGVARDVHRVGYREPPSMQFYIPLGEPGGFGGLRLVVRPRDGEALARLRATLAGVDPIIAHVDLRSLSTELEPQARPWRLGAWVLGMASGLALLVALSGVYGVLSYLVEQRRREIGVRMALGASRSDIGRQMLGTGLAAAAMGTVGGAALLAVAARHLQPLLFETSVGDLRVIGSVLALLALSALAACALPATRAAAVEPTVTLREE